MKAFLSHSSKDKPIVDAVQKELGRQFTLSDSNNFETGEEFVQAIRRCLDEAGIFVLFASRNSMASIWVKLELEEAWQRKLRGTIKRSLVYIIDDLNVHELPDWIQQALVRKDNVARSIARDIRFNLDQLLRERLEPYFVGRGSDLGRLESLMTPTDGSQPPRGFVVFGLPGIGRRTLIRHGSANILGLRKIVEIRLDDGDSINDICAKTADITEPVSTAAQFKDIFQFIQSLQNEDALERTLRNLRSLLDAGELPIFVDEGGFLDSEGYIRAPALDLLTRVNSSATTYLAFVCFRKPQNTQNLAIPVLRLDPLAKPDTQRLLQRLAADSEIVMTKSELTEIADYVAGYPPSAYFAVQQAKNYGVGVVVSHKRRLVEFRTGVFLRHLDVLGLETSEGKMLQLLSSFSPLPLACIPNALEASLETISNVLTHLIDLSLVVVDGDGFYRISDPIADAASNIYGFPSQKRAGLVSKAIERFMSEASIQHRYLDLSRVLFRASKFSGEGALEGTTIRLAGDLIRLTEEYYHARQYQRSIEYGKLAVVERPDTINGRSYLIRALIQVEDWQGAERELKELRRFAPPRDVHFLQGFLERRRGDHRKAIDEFQEALRLGRRGAAIYRELCQSYFLIGELDSARDYLATALQRHGDNRYVVDLWAQLAAERGDENEARQALARLEIIDRPVYFNFRKSRVEWRFGKIEEARDSALVAFNEDKDRPPFSVVAQVVLCDIALEKVDEATIFLGKLDRDFGDIRRDVRTGLHCRLQIAKGDFTEALRLTNRFVQKDSPYYRIIRHDALRGELATGGLSEALRLQYQGEVDQVRQALGVDLRFDIPELDTFSA